MSRRSCLVALVLLAAAALPSCRPAGPPAPAGAGAAATATAPAAPKPSPFAFDRPVRRPEEAAPPAAGGACPRFEEVASARGLEHRYDNGETGGSLMVEAIGGGVGWLDYDADGRLDLYLNQAGSPTATDRSGEPVDALFRGLPSRAGGAAFAPVAAAAGIRETGYGQGVAVGDFDADGFDDVYVTNVGANSLYHNRGDGTFEEVALAAGVADERWSSSAAWADLDGDSDLDLYVCNYVQYDPLHPLDCRDTKKRARICHPRDVEHWPDECYENLGDGTFRPVAAAWGLAGPGNKALGVAVADFTGDGLPDIYVANDTTANFLFVNRGRGADGRQRYEESATLLGCAVDRNGMPQASMGLAVGDYDGDGWLDIYSTHYYEESNTLYRNLGGSGFEDVTAVVGLHEPTLARLGFGTAMADFDADGRQELLVANGHVENYAGNPLLRMKPQLFSFGGSRFSDCSAAAGPWFDGRLVGRGVALADYDADGDLDAAVACQNDPVALLENASERGHWIAFRFRGAGGNRRGIGTRVTVAAGGREWVGELCGGTSYASSHEPVVAIGLGAQAGPCRVTVRWPSGAVETLDDVAVDRAHVLREPGGQGADGADAAAGAAPPGAASAAGAGGAPVAGPR